MSLVDHLAVRRGRVKVVVKIKMLWLVGTNLALFFASHVYMGCWRSHRALGDGRREGGLTYVYCQRVGRLGMWRSLRCDNCEIRSIIGIMGRGILDTMAINFGLSGVLEL